MAIEIIEITDEEIIGLETKKIRVPIKKLRDYALEKRFEYEGVWYFRKAWMNQRDSHLFEQSGLIEKAETANHLRDKGVPIPFESGHGLVKIYGISNDKLDKMISEKKQNGKTAKS